MGITTSNMSIYIPSAGETNYDASFLAGMLNVDQHDHSGPPDKGVPLSSAGIADGSITAVKLNANVLATGGGLSFNGSNQIQTAGLLNSIFGLAGTGFIAATGAGAAVTRTFTGASGQIVITNPGGVAGAPNFSIDPAFLPGKLVQTVFTNGIAGSSTSSPTFVAVTGASLAITPTSTANLVKCTFSFEAQANNIGATNNTHDFQILRGATVISGTDGLLDAAISAGGGNGAYNVVTYVIIDTPASIASNTYSIQHRSSTSNVISTTLINIVLEEIVVP